MEVLRYLLLLMTAAALAVVGYGVIQVGGIEGSELLSIGLVVIGLILNFIYIYYSDPTVGLSRLARLSSLRRDAKLRERASGEEAR